MAATTAAEVVLASTSGGIINTSLVEDLRGDAVTGDAKDLAEIARFVDRDGNKPTKAAYEADFEAAFDTGKALWSAYASELQGDEPMETSRLRERLLIPFLRQLGFEPIYQRSRLPAGDGTFRVTHLGWDADEAPPLILEPGGLDDRVGAGRSPHAKMQAYLNSASRQWGIVTNGTHLRILRDFHHTRTQGYVQFDVAAIFNSGSVSDFRALWRLCHASRFQPATTNPTEPTASADSSTDTDDIDDDGPIAVDVAAPGCLLEALHQKSLTAGVTAGKRLQPQVRAAIQELANGALDATPELRQRLHNEAAFGRTLYGELLTVLYRTLFLLFAEQRGMLSGANSLYKDTYSLSALRETADAHRYETRRHDLWEGLKATFSAFTEPDLADALGVYPYNGELFDAARTPHLGTARVPNRNVAAAIRSLTTVQVGTVLLHVDYRNLGVEELGTVYESLLDYTLRVAESPLAVDGRQIRTGDAYLVGLSTERADLASYYTPPALVSLVLDRSLDPVIAGAIEYAGTDPAAKEAALLDLRVIDPACGSGAFLVGAIDRIALAVAQTRTHPSEPADDDVAAARRDVLAHCIYGADKDPFAVELCKVALWIHCAVADAPLSFLDHHIVCGDSLVGWPMFEIPTDIPSEAFEFAKADTDTKKLLAAARKINREYLEDLAKRGSLFGPPDPSKSIEPLVLPGLLETEDRTYSNVRAKAAAYADYLASDAYLDAKAAADLWTAAFFWTTNSGTPPTSRDYHRALNHDPDPDLTAHAGTIIEPLNPLHWCLAFPDVRDHGGFDLVISNPPWTKFTVEERAFFAHLAPDLAAMTSGDRKRAVEELQDDDPVVYSRWVRFKSAQMRLSHYVNRASARFAATTGEPNTYALFTDTAARLMNERGRCGLVVSAGIAFDKDQSRLWKQLVSDGRVLEVVEMVNGTRGGRDPVFPAVADVARFCVLVLGPGGATALEASTLSFGLGEALSRPLTPWSAADLQLVSPRTGTLVSCRNEAEVQLVRQLHAGWPTLDFDRITAPDGRNPWNVSYVNLFHSSGANAKGLMLKSESLEASGFEKNERQEMAGPSGEVALPVYEGQLANRWDHRARTYANYSGTNKYGRKPNIPWVTSTEHRDPGYEVEPRYWMRESVARERIAARIGDRVVVAFRDTGAPWRNRRTMRACLLFPTPATDRLPLFAVPREHALAFCALLNSTVFDFLVRVHTPSVKTSSWVVSQCPAPPPDAVGQRSREISMMLSATSNKLADAYGLDLCVWDEEERALLDAENDALMARLYGLDRESYEVVLGHFVLLGLMETKEYGEYRTRRLCLEAWDRLDREGV